MQFILTTLSIATMAATASARSSEQSNLRVTRPNKRYPWHRALGSTNLCDNGVREDVCASAKGKHSCEPGVAPVAEVWSGNPNCVDMGFDFGWKSPDPGCIDTAQPYNGGYLSMTDLANDCVDCDTTNVGNYTMDCHGVESGGQFTEVDLSSSVDVAVFIKGGKDGGHLYFLESETVYSNLKVPNGQAISHIEFCFICQGPTAAPTMYPTATPTKLPSSAPTDAPTKSPTDAPTDQPTMSPTNSATKTPTVAPTNAPVSHPPTKAPSAEEPAEKNTAAQDPKQSCKGSIETDLSSAPDGKATVVAKRGNPNCVDMGYDFGWKSPDPGCMDTAQGFSDGYLTLTGAPPDSCNIDQVGSYMLDCHGPEGNGQFSFVDITTNVDVGVFVKGGKNGGNLYELEGGKKYGSLSPGGGYAISHIEFCFKCSGPVVSPMCSDSAEPEPEPEATPSQTIAPTKPPTAGPTKAPTDSPSKSPTDGPTKAPTGAPTKAPTDTPTKAPTFAPTKAPTDTPTKPPTISPTMAPSDAPTLAPSDTPSTAPTPCDKCDEAPLVTNVPADDKVCPTDLKEPSPFAVNVMDKCGAVVTDGVVAKQSPVSTGDVCNGEVTNTWTAHCPGCSDPKFTTVSQTIHVIDDEPPVFTDTMLPDMSYTCPNDFMMADLSQLAPGATDSCCADVHLSYSHPDADSCNPVEIIWKAEDDCGNMATMPQTVTFGDNKAPTLNGETPLDLTISCGSGLPAPAELIFTDNCAGNMPITSADSKPFGDLCSGKTVRRTWVGPTDACGNKADDIVQTITEKDTDMPKFEDALPLAPVTSMFECSKDYDESMLMTPGASDDCGVTVTSTSVPLSCGAKVTWTATDVCGNSASADQEVSFSDNTPPELADTAPTDITLMCKDPMPDRTSLSFSDNCGETFTVESSDSESYGDVCNGKVTVRTWTGPTDVCGNSAMDFTQKITISDQEAPKLPASMEDVTMTCPSDFPGAVLTPPMAEDDCCADVTVTSDASSVTLDGCSPLTVTWTATDDCGKESTVPQVINFSDSQAPILKDSPPVATTVSCGAYPVSKSLLFSDNCAGDMHVAPSDALVGGNVCSGEEYMRTWVGPKDSCGNAGQDVTQVITILDQTGPAFDAPCEEAVMTCPGDFDALKLVAPSASDDCTKDVDVTNTIPAYDMCSSGFDIEWTASDSCGKTAKTTQAVRFTNTQMPTIACPAEATVSGAGGILSHMVNLGTCFSDSDVSFSITPACEECDCVGGGSCSTFDYDVVGGDLVIKRVPNKAKISWTTTMSYGCGEQTITCSANVESGGETMFGKPQSPKENSILDLDQSRWGWYQTTAQGPGKHTFDMWAGAANNDLTKGTYVGTVEVTVQDCADSSTSTADWSGIPGDSGLCVVHHDHDHHLHVGHDYPRTNKGEITVGPGSFTPGCCEQGKTCYIFVHGVVDSMTCGDGGCS